MPDLSKIFHRLILEEEGATAIQYALIATLVSTAIIVGVTQFSGSVAGVWEYISDTVTSALAGS